MNEYAGLNELTPLILKYPFEKLFKAFFNIKLGKKILKSIGTIFAFSLGIFVGFTFPGLGYFIVFLLNILFSIPVNSAIISGISMVVTMVLASSLFIYLNEKIFQSYNITKYGFSNTDWIFTKKDRDLLELIISSDDESLTPEQVKKNAADIEHRFRFLVEKIRVYKITRQVEKKNTAKYALQCLRRGELSVFLDYFEDDFLRRSKRMENLKQSRLDHRSSTSLDTLSENPSEIQSPVAGRTNQTYQGRIAKPSLKVTDYDVSSEANFDSEREEMDDTEQYKPMVHKLVRSVQKDRQNAEQDTKPAMLKRPVISRDIYNKENKTNPRVASGKKTLKHHR